MCVLGSCAGRLAALKKKWPGLSPATAMFSNEWRAYFIAS